MNILITGGAGYIGSLATQLLLDAGHNVYAIDALWFNKDIPLSYQENSNYKFIEGDICDLKSIDEILLNNIDYIVHTAAIVGEPASRKFPELTYKINYEASIDLIKKSREIKIKGFIFLSTCSNYGISKTAATEESSLNPLSLYAETKVNVERFLMDSPKELDWVILRLATVYGISPRMRFDLTVNDFTLNAFIKKYLYIFLPFAHRPYIHVFDAARAISQVIKKFNSVKNNVLNTGFNGEVYKKIDIAESIKRIIQDIHIEIIEKGKDLRDYQVDFSKLEKSLGLKNSRTVEDGIAEIIDSLKEGKFGNPGDDIYYNTSPRLGGKSWV